MSPTQLQRENTELRQALAQREAALSSNQQMLEQKAQRITTLEQQTELLADSLSKAVRENQLLHDALKEAQRRRSGQAHDDPGQLALLFAECTAAPEEPAPPHVDEAPDGETPTDPIQRRHRRKGAARKLDWAALPREHVTHELSPHERLCPKTGLVLVEVGETTFEELEYRAAKLVVLVHHSKVYGLSEQDAEQRQAAPITAPLPPRPIEKSPASASLLSWMLVQKYVHHLPLYRQEAILAREGLQIPRQTQCDWVAACARLLAPIQAALCRGILASGRVQLDDTPVQCQQGRGSRKTQAYLWVLLSPLVEGVVYRFTPGRGYDHVQPLLGELGGVLVGDGYAVHHKLAEASGGRLVTAGCWSHALRKFRDAIPESPRDAAALVVSIGALFEVEKQADEQQLSHEQRLLLRQERGPALLADIEQQRSARAGRSSEKGKLAEALTYLGNQWPSLVRFLEHGDIPIHNNACERAIRPVAVGRRNWLFAGSLRGGETAATIYSLVESCKRAGVDPYAYLADVLVRVNTHPASRIDELLPARWNTIFGAPAVN